MKRYRNSEDMIGDLFTWGPFALILFASMVASPANAKIAETPASKMSVSAVASAVISKGVGFKDQRPTYGRFSSHYIAPQQTSQPCPETRSKKCTMILMEIQ